MDCSLGNSCTRLLNCRYIQPITGIKFPGNWTPIYTHQTSINLRTVSHPGHLQIKGSGKHQTLNLSGFVYLVIGEKHLGCIVGFIYKLSACCQEILGSHSLPLKPNNANRGTFTPHSAKINLTCPFGSGYAMWVVLSSLGPDQSSEVWDSNVGRCGGTVILSEVCFCSVWYLCLCRRLPTIMCCYCIAFVRAKSSSSSSLSPFQSKYRMCAYNVARHGTRAWACRIKFHLAKNRNQAHVTGSHQLGDIPGFSSQKLIIQPFQWDFSIRLAFCCTNWIINVS